MAKKAKLPVCCRCGLRVLDGEEGGRPGPEHCHRMHYECVRLEIHELEQKRAETWQTLSKHRSLTGGSA